MDVKGMSFGTKAPGLKAWRCHSLTTCVILGQGPALSMPQFLLLQKGALTPVPMCEPAPGME